MTVEELEKLLDLALGAWGQQPPRAELGRLRAAWWRYLGDFDQSEVLAAIDDFISSSPRWMPRVGEVRRKVIESRVGSPPSPGEAWAALLQWRSDIEYGLVPDDVHPLVKDTVVRLGAAAAGLYSNSDRDFFTKEYEKTCEEYYSRKYRTVGEVDEEIGDASGESK